MNRLWITLLSLFALTSLVHAQEDIRFRAKVGMGASGYIDSNIDYAFGYNLGGYTDIQFKEAPVFLTTGLSVVKRGGKGDTSIGDLKINAFYLEVPVHVRVESGFFDFENISYFGSIGPYVGLGLFGKTKWDSYSYTKPSLKPGVGEETIRVEGDSVSSFSDGRLRRFDVGMGANFGLIFSQRVELSGTFSLGFVDAMKQGGGKNQHISLNLGYIF